jgi:hypothetical protein
LTFVEIHRFCGICPKTFETDCRQYNANPSGKCLDDFLFYLVTLNPIIKIQNPDPLEALFKSLTFLFKFFVPEVDFLCSQGNVLQ